MSHSGGSDSRGGEESGVAEPAHWDCGVAQYPDVEQIRFELALGIAVLRLVCGAEPKGCSLEVEWHEHDVGRYATISLVWAQGSLSTREERYIEYCRVVLDALDDTLGWTRLWDRLTERLAEESELAASEIEPSPLMLEVADLDGNLKPEFQEWEGTLPLSAGSSVPTWWPERVEGQLLSPEDVRATLRRTLRRWSA